VTRDLTRLVGRLGVSSRDALERASEFALSSGTLGVAELFAGLVSDPDVHEVLRRAGLDPGDFLLERSRSSTSTVPVPTLGFIQAVESAVGHTAMLGIVSPSAGELLASLLDDSAARAVVTSTLPTLGLIPKGMSSRILDRVRSAGPSPTAVAKSPKSEAPRGRVAMSGLAALERYAVNLTAQARERALDAAVGREGEIRQLIDVLVRRRQNNPVLVGDAGVGKTAIVEGLALRIALGTVPPMLQGVELYSLDLGLLRAGASMAGEFEGRLRAVVDAVEAESSRVVLFIDEVHTLVGAGGRAGTQDAANLLKPALARGTLRAIGATTWVEYKRHIESDAALARRFHAIPVNEPGAEGARMMVRSLVPRLEAHHGVRILDEAVEQAVRLSVRYLAERRLPDKAVGLLDTAAARVAVGLTTIPEPIESVRARILAVDLEIDQLTRELGLGRDHSKRISALYAALDRLEGEHAELFEQWEAERHSHAPSGDGEGSRLLPRVVDGRVVAGVVSEMTRVPLERLTEADARAAHALPARLATRVFGQERAVAQLARVGAAITAGLGSTGRPAACLVFIGPHGVGKTTAARALAELVTGDALLSFSGSDFSEAHSVATLRGAPPGYVGFGGGGLLTEGVRRRPHSIILLEDAGEAHPAVLALFRTIAVTGRLDDAEGLGVDFSNAILILSVSVEDTDGDDDGWTRLGPTARLPRELLQSATLVSFVELSTVALTAIASAGLTQIGDALRSRYDVAVIIGEGVAGIVARSVDTTLQGARPVIAWLKDVFATELASLLLEQEVLPAAIAVIDEGPAILLVPSMSEQDAESITEDGFVSSSSASVRRVRF
jgi:type VI secretion system protein VasG